MDYKAVQPPQDGLVEDMVLRDTLHGSARKGQAYSTGGFTESKGALRMAGHYLQTAWNKSFET